MTTTTFINTMSARSNTHNNTCSTNNGAGGSSLPSPISPNTVTASSCSSVAPFLDLLLHQNFASIPNDDPDHGLLSPEDRTRLSSELEQLRSLCTEARQTYLSAIHGSIQQYQQLVLSTHAQVAAAKQSLLKARGSLSASSSTASSLNYFANNINNNITYSLSNTSSRASSPPASPGGSISPRSRSNSFSISCNQLQSQDAGGAGSFPDLNEEEMRYVQLSQAHADLGGRLSQLLRDKANAEETKKRLNDGLNKAKVRIKELERRLGE